MLDSCLVRASLLVILVELMSILNARPQPTRLQLPRPPLFSELLPYNSTSMHKKFKRSPAKVVFEKNDTKERILNTSNRGSLAFAEYSEQAIVFPDSPEVAFEPVPRVNGAPKCAAGGTFCESFDAYPYQQLREALHRRPVDKEFFFGQDEVPVELEKRIGIEEGNFFCDIFTKTVFPKVAKNKNDEWKYIVNQGQGEGYVQGVRIETCRSEGQPCNLIGQLPHGYRTLCKQKYVYRRLLSLNEDGTFIPDTFKLPASCCCAYETDFLARIGLPNR